mgnify:CR=1 FL=1
MFKSNLSNPKQEKHLDQYNHDADYKKAWDAKHAHQHKQSETPLSGGSHANETDIIEALNSTSTGNSFFNSYWFGLLVVVVFLAAIFLTNSCLGL